MAVYRSFARMLRMAMKPFASLDAIPDLDDTPEPVVFVSRHRNLRGPIFTLLHLPREVRPWAYSVFCDSKSCYEHYMKFTFGERLAWNPLLAKTLARLLSFVVPRLISSMGGIPVYRKSVQVKKTFSQSLEALRRKESLIIYPDIDYTSTSNEPGAIYSGFLLIGRMYRKSTGKDLSFVPLDVDMKRRALLMGKPVVFEGKRNFDKERARVASALLGELTNLGAIITGLDQEVGE